MGFLTFEKHDSRKPGILVLETGNAIKHPCGFPDHHFFLISLVLAHQRKRKHPESGRLTHTSVDKPTSAVAALFLYKLAKRPACTKIHRLVFKIEKTAKTTNSQTAKHPDSQTAKQPNSL